jgi:hypothetical protein
MVALEKTWRFEESKRIKDAAETLRKNERRRKEVIRSVTNSRPPPRRPISLKPLSCSDEA